MQNSKCKIKVWLSVKLVEELLYNLLVVEVVLFGADDLVIFVTFAGEEDNIAWLCQHHRGFYCFVAVGDF